MRSGFKKFAKASVATVVGAVAAVFLLPAGNAYAADKVGCDGRDDLLHLWAHETTGAITVSWDDCWANRGIVRLTHNPGSVERTWLDKVSTGNNDVTLYDCDVPNKVDVRRGNILNFPNRPMNLCAFEIK